jgi:hypothetical protein
MRSRDKGSQEPIPPPVGTTARFAASENWGGSRAEPANQNAGFSR